MILESGGAALYASLFQAVGSRVLQWHLRAAMAERERLAHEIHDTLAQSFAGIGFQLQAIQRSVPDSLPQLRQQVRHAADLVRHSHKEARRSFAPPRTGDEQPVDLIAELEHSVRQMLDDGLIEITVTITGNPVEIPARMTAELLRIGQEAIANTVQHAAASRLDLLLRFSTTYVALTVEDDGVGFVKSGDLLGLGLRGMRKRAASIGAQLEIDSSPGNGARIRVTAPLPTRLTVREPAKLIWTYLRSIFRHAAQHL